MIDTPDALRALPRSSLPAVADELREELLAIVAETGGHLGAGLGVANVKSVQLLPDGESSTSSGWAPAAQLGAGVTVDLDETAFIDIGYRLKAAASAASTTSGIQYVGDGQFVGAAVATGGPIVVQTLQVGLNIRME